MDSRVFLEGMTIIETLLGLKLLPEQGDIYMALLSDLNENEFILGINSMLRERVFTNFPSPAEIRKYCLGTRDEDLEIRCAEARIKLKKAVNSVGTYNSVVFDDPVIHLVVQSFGGWIKLGTLEFDEYEKLLKWEFPKLYKAYAVRKNKEIPLVLPGRNGSEEVLYIGDRARAERWVLKYVGALGAPLQTTPKALPWESAIPLESMIGGLSQKMGITI